MENQSGKSANANGGNFGTPMSSAEEPTPANVGESNARGNAIFQLNQRVWLEIDPAAMVRVEG